MTIASAITNAQQKVANAYTAISNKGGTLPATQNLSNIVTAIDSVSTPDKWFNWASQGSSSTNFTNVGSVTISSNHVAYGFSTSSYLKTNPAFSPQNNETWEVRLKIMTGSSHNTYEAMFTSMYDTHPGIWIAMENSGYLTLSLSSNGSQWNICDQVTSYFLSLNTVYFIIAGYDGTQYYLKAKTSSQTEYTTVYTLTSSTKVYNGLNGSYFGVRDSNAGSQTVFRGQIYLDNVELVKNDVVVWTPYTTTIGNEVYTLTAAPTTSTQVYDAPHQQSSLTITSVGEGSITCSDTKTYYANTAGDIQEGFAPSIVATNTTGSTILEGDKVWVEPDVNKNFTTTDDTVVINDNLIANVPSDKSINPSKETQPSSFTNIEVQMKIRIPQVTPTSTSYPSDSYLFYLRGAPVTTQANSMVIALKSLSSSSYCFSASISSMTAATITPTSGSPLYNFSTSTWFWLKFTKTGSTWKFSYSTDGSTWTDVGTFSYVVNFDQLYTLSFYGAQKTPQGCEYDLNECYIKFGDSIYWKPTVNTTYNIIPSKSVSNTSITGIAQEAIANSSTGAVKTLLDGNGTYAPTKGTKTITTNNTYTASADDLYGYSSVTVNVSAGGKYQLLDRVKDDNNNEIGTVSGFFTDANDVEYAVVCLDAQYRLAPGKISTIENQLFNTPPVYNSWNVWEAKETATQNTTSLLTDDSTSPACTHCRSKSFIIDNVTYYGQLPNIIEISDILKNHTYINTADTSATSNPTLILQYRQTLSSTLQEADTPWYTQGGSIWYNSANISTLGGIIVPVLEIPNS